MTQKLRLADVTLTEENEYTEMESGDAHESTFHVTDAIWTAHIRGRLYDNPSYETSSITPIHKAPIVELERKGKTAAEAMLMLKCAIADQGWELR